MKDGISQVRKKLFQILDKNPKGKLHIFWNQIKYVQNALATAILSRIEINGSAINDEPTCVIISVKYSVWLLTVVCIGGIWISGKPDATWPVEKKFNC